MATLFYGLEQEFFNALYQRTTQQRRAALETWAEYATPIIQRAMSQEIQYFIESVTDGEGARLISQQDEKAERKAGNTLVMSVMPRKLQPWERVGQNVEAPPRGPGSPHSGSPCTVNCAVDDDDDTVDHSSNDDRSDSMNPNNDDYRASNDNRSDQMNPNNDAYHSSRG